ncbi:PAS domain-containing sensor histidine kinase [Actinophytocola algeriensis]|uniref:histidine kinase n=1 Tax=Actinophytocola algeriensis TaxID=1768010 RepID=A0A7W7QAQ2_9PSEU|nr:PAS domain S-box protein [Actinophytocola algeriensis]MBB4909799.1 PAS domain S-box-containing protein [Actinophytocola algeriensis]MBE1475789.1 PAS domain S-box-containing protein [Actinophytocola algeriensis]
MQPDDGYRMLVRNVRDYAIFMLDPAGHIISWNAGAERIKGYTEDEIIGKHFSVFYPAEDSDKPARELREAIANGRLEDEGWRVRKDGTRFWANVVITALFDDNGELRGFGKVTRDMTERHHAEEALRASEERFRLVVQGVRDYGIFMLDPTGHIISWNAGAERIKGYTEDEIIGKHFSVFYPAEDAGKPERELREAIANGRLEDEGWRVRKDGTRFWANVVITALFDDNGELRGFGKVTRDMTERRIAEQALLERRRLLSHFVEAQELERRRIAWDVHDDSIQAMVAVGMRLQLLAGRLPDEQRPVMAQLEETVRASVSRLRNLVVHLRPTAIDEHGLVPALTGYLRDAVEGWGLGANLSADLAVEPPTATAITIFRICQEALSNVRKHAGATRVDIALTSTDGGTLTEVRDDGRGFPDPATGHPNRHFGLIEMRERAETAGGWWSVDSVPDEGTTVRFWLPNALAEVEGGA